MSNWRYEFERSLLKNENKHLSAYIISKEWLDKYEEFIFSSQNEPELIDFIKNYHLDDASLFNSSNIKEFQKISVLNESCIKALIGDSNLELKNLDGRFTNKIFIVEILNKKDNKVYAIFFMDKNSQLVQGYLSIHKLDKEKEIFKNIKKYYNNKNTTKKDRISLYIDGFDLHTFESEKRKYDNNPNGRNKAIKLFIIHLI